MFEDHSSDGRFGVPEIPSGTMLNNQLKAALKFKINTIVNF